MADRIVLTAAEAEELYRYMVHSYLDPNTWPHLRRLLDRIDLALRVSDRKLAEVGK